MHRIHRLAMELLLQASSSPGAPHSMKEGCRATSQVLLVATLEPNNKISRVTDTLVGAETQIPTASTSAPLELRNSAP